CVLPLWLWVFFFQAEDGIRDATVTGVQTCALPIFIPNPGFPAHPHAEESRIRNDRGEHGADQGKPNDQDEDGKKGSIGEPRTNEIGRASCREREEVVAGEVSATRRGR